MVGIYIVIVVDVFNNSVIKNVIVIQLDLVNVDIIVDNCILFIIIMVIGSGGEFFYNYNWNIGQIGFIIIVLGVGIYCVIMIDQDFCGVVECIMVDFMFLDVNVNVNNIICLGDNDG